MFEYCHETHVGLETHTSSPPRASIFCCQTCCRLTKDSMEIFRPKFLQQLDYTLVHLNTCVWDTKTNTFQASREKRTPGQGERQHQLILICPATRLPTSRCTSRMLQEAGDSAPAKAERSNRKRSHRWMVVWWQLQKKEDLKKCGGIRGGDLSLLVREMLAFYFTRTALQ